MTSRSDYPCLSRDLASPESAASPARWPQEAGDRAHRWRLFSPARAKSWDGHVRHLEELADTPGFRRLRAQIIALADLAPNDQVLDIGAGTGLLTLAAAAQAAHVTALDISVAMCAHLEDKLAGRSIDNVDVLVGSAAELPIADGSIDVILSNYCFHHLRDSDKRRALSEAARVLRPGGRLVAGDMMFQMGLKRGRDREVMTRFAGQMLRRGPAGVIRLLKNALRFARGRGEHPASIDWWREALREAAFSEVVVVALEHEGGIASARRPGAKSTAGQPRHDSDTSPCSTDALRLDGCADSAAWLSEAACGLASARRNEAVAPSTGHR